MDCIWPLTVSATLYLAFSVWQFRDSKRRRNAYRNLHNEFQRMAIRAIEEAALPQIQELKIDLARAGRALLAHPQGHDQQLIDDAMGWVGDDNVRQAFERPQHH